MKRVFGAVKVGFVCAVAISVTAPRSEAAIITVNAAGGGNHTTIQAAMNAAISGDIIDIVTVGPHTESGMVLTSNKDLTIRGQGADVTIVQAAATPESGGGRLFDLSSRTATVTFQDMTLRNAHTTGPGGAIYVGNWNANSNLVIERVAFLDNVGSAGGAIWHGDDNDPMTMTIIDSLFAGNKTTNGSAGAVYTGVAGDVTVRNTTFSDNSESTTTAWTTSGALSIRGTTAGTKVVQNSTFVGNSKTYLSSGVPSNKTYGAALTGNANVIVESCLFSDNTTLGTGDNMVGVSHKNTVHTGNLLNTTDLGGNLLVADAMVDVLADNGGPTWTRALLAGSPAIDAGSNPAGLAYDQRGPGYARTVGAGTDAGAYETPEPATLALLALGSFGLAALCRRRK